MRRILELATRYADHTRMLWRVAPRHSTISLLCTLISAAATILTMIATGRLIGALYTRDTDAMWTWFAVFAGATIATQLTQAITTISNPRIWSAYRARINDLIAEAGLHSHSLEPLDSEIGRELGVVTDSSRHWLFRFGMTGTWPVLRARLIAVGSVAVLLPWRWWVPLVVAAAFGAASKSMGGFIDKLINTLWGAPHMGRQRAEYVTKLMVGATSAKEVRLFGIAGWLRDRQTRLWESADRTLWREADRQLIPFFIVLLPMILAIGGSLALLAYDAYNGRVASESVTTYLLAILALESFGPQGDNQSGLVRVSGMLKKLGALRESLGLPALTPAEEPHRSQPSTVSAEIDFTHVAFTYPSRDEPTLRGLTLHVPAGQSIAIVGVNGAGKSTLIKLLAGLYDVDSGSVTIGGRDAFDNESVRGKVAVIFQDFVHYPLSLRDNVGFGAIEHRDETPLLEAAMNDAGGADVLDRLDHDWDKVLSREFAGGTDLSGGQWQRVALARALAAVSSGAEILVLDEPTAALDVRAEAALFDRFLDVTRGVTTILVSHRLSTVRHAERIVVLDGATGHITEDGTHEELMTLGGQYAEMFTLQATRFAQAGTVDES